MNENWNRCKQKNVCHAVIFQETPLFPPLRAGGFFSSISRVRSSSKTSVSPRGVKIPSGRSLSQSQRVARCTLVCTKLFSLQWWAWDEADGGENAVCSEMRKRKRFLKNADIQTFFCLHLFLPRFICLPCFSCDAFGRCGQFDRPPPPREMGCCAER